MFNHSTNRCKCCHQSEILFDIQTKMKQNKKKLNEFHFDNNIEKNGRKSI